MQEYEFDYEEEIDRLKKEIAKEQQRTRECQKEINRLRVIVRDCNRVMETITKPDYEKLFELWADFDDDESRAEVVNMSEQKSLGPMDTMSFTGFCAGFAAAAKILEEE